MDAAQIKIGIAVVDDSATAAVMATTGSSVAFGDTKAFSRVLVEWVNDNGGLAGRELVPVFYELDSAQVIADESVPVQEACTAWTEDDQVWAALIPVAAQSSGYVHCLSARNTPVLSEAISLAQGEFDARPDFFYSPAGLLLERLARSYVGALVGEGFLSAESTIGLLTVDDPAYVSVVESSLRPELERRGVTVADEVRFTAPFGVQDPWEAYVLRFKTAGVDRILHLGGSGWPILQFAQAAESQDYHPRYGLNSTSAMSDLEKLLPESQLEGARGVSWLPGADVGESQRPGVLNPEQAVCLEIMSDEDLSGPGPYVWALAYCSVFMMLKRGADEAPALNPRGFATAVEAWGSDAASPLTFGVRYGPGRHDGAAEAGDVAYDVACTCFKYTGVTRELG